MKLKDRNELVQRLATRTETKSVQRQRIGALLADEVKEYQTAGLPDQILGLKVFDALIDARVEIENLATLATRLSLQLGINIENFIKDAKAAKSR